MIAALNKPNRLTHACVLNEHFPGNLHGQIASGVFIFVGGVDGKYCATAISRATTIASDALNFIRTARNQLGEQAPIKIIGFEEELISVTTGLKDAGIEANSIVPRHTPFEVIYEVASGRLRVSTNDKIKVLIVDDSATMRKILRQIIGSDTAFDIIGEAALPSEVEGLIKRDKPDVMTLDIEMPEMNGVELIKKILPKYKVPTVLISAISRHESNIVLEGLEAGAVDYIQKPKGNDLDKMRVKLTKRLRAAANAKVVVPEPILASMKSTSVIKFTKEISTLQSSLIVIGSSTGGTEALKRILTKLPKDIPPILIAQHIPGAFSGPFAQRLSTLCNFPVAEGQDGEEIVAGRVYLAPGGRQMRVIPSGDKSGLKIVINDDAAGSLHKPSVDNLFDSVAKYASKRRIISIILTGMGSDGSNGMVSLKKIGSSTIAQDENTSVIFGMPAEAIKAGCVDHITPLDEIASKLMQIL